MNKLISIILLMIAVLPVQGLAFQHSKEEELELLIQYFENELNLSEKEIKEVMIDEDISRDEVLSDIRTYKEKNKEHCLKVITRRIDSLTPMNDYITRMDLLISRLDNDLDSDNADLIRYRRMNMQKALDIFNYLKIRMNIPEEVCLYFDEINEDVGIDAGYLSHSRSVYLSNDFFSHAPSTYIYTLIHELTHTQQHQRLGIVNFTDSNSFDLEREAETSSITAVSCPVCTQILEDKYCNESSLQMELRSREGYLIGSEIQKYKQQKKDTDICRAHAANTEQAQKLRLLVFQPLNFSQRMFGSNIARAIERAECDVQISGSVEDRLSSVRFEK